MNAASLNEIAYDLLNIIRGGRSSNTENISLEQLKYNINHYRATFIRRDMWRNNNRGRMYEQDLGHLSMESIDSAEDDSISSGNIVYRTNEVIPSPVRLKESEAITKITCKDKIGHPIPLLDDSRSYWEQFNKYTSDNVHASYRGGHIYIFNNVGIQNIHVRGIFEDPEEAYNFTKNNDIEAYDHDEPYPIPTDMLEGIKKGLINGELKIITGALNDDNTDMSQDEQ